MTDFPTLVEPVRNLRGTSIFSSQSLQKVWNETVAPELDDTHTIVGVGTVTTDGLKAAIIFRKPISFMNSKGEWIVEGAFLHDWSGANDVEAKVLFKI